MILTFWLEAFDVVSRLDLSYSHVDVSSCSPLQQGKTLDRFLFGVLSVMVCLCACMWQ